MASNFACVGLPVASDDELQSLLRQVVPLAAPVGRAGKVEVVRWQDASGARLVLGLQGGAVVDLLPSFAAAPSARLRSIEFVSDDVARAAVVDEHGDQVTELTVEFEERRLLRERPAVTEGVAGIVAFGVDVQAFEDADAFGQSPAGVVASDRAPDEPPPPHVLEHGLAWPPRWAAESFMSFGVFERENPSAHARLSGTVVEADVRTVALTGRQFVHAEVRTVGFHAHVCFPYVDGAAVPVPGNVISGVVFLVGAMPRAVVAETGRRTRFRPFR